MTYELNLKKKGGRHVNYANSHYNKFNYVTQLQFAYKRVVATI